MVQLIKQLIFGFSSGPDLIACGIKSYLGLHTQRESPWIFSPSAPSPTHYLPLSKINKSIFLNERNISNEQSDKEIKKIIPRGESKWWKSRDPISTGP